MKRRTFQKGEWLGESVGFYKASPVFLSVVLETSAPALSEQLVNAVNADLQVPPEDSDSVGQEWDQRICILIQPQVIPSILSLRTTTTLCPSTVPVNILIYSIIYSNMCT